MYPTFIIGQKIGGSVKVRFHMAGKVIKPILVATISREM